MSRTLTPAEQAAREKKADGRTRRAATTSPIRELREKLGLSLRDVAKRIKDVSHVTIADYELGLIDPKLSVARKLARFFGKTVDELWPEEAD